MSSSLARAVVQIEADLTKLKQDVAQAGKDIQRSLGQAGIKGAQKAERDLVSLGKSLKSTGASMADIGRTMTIGVSLPLAVAAKAAIDFESAFAGVRKTVDASEAEFAEFSQGFRDMAKEIPTSAVELAKIGEVAGQLGIKKEGILEFTRVVADLGETTNLAGDAAATALARLSNIMGTSQQDFDRLGSTIVGLGNAGASTESEIVDMGLRIAGAGKQVGLTEHQVLGFANALSSVGIEAEAGGTAISRVLSTMAKEVKSGGENLEGFARVAGMSASEFRSAFEKDAATATIAFIEGLDGIKQSGGDVFTTLEQLELGDIRVRDALLRAAGAGDLFTESLELGSKAWAENTALTDEARKRYETTQAKLEIFRNKIVDVAISLGGALLPPLTKMLELAEPVIDMAARAAEGFSRLPQPLQLAGGALLGIVAAAGPLLLVGGKIVESVGSSIAAWGKLRTTIRGFDLANRARAFWGLGEAAAGASKGVLTLNRAMTVLKVTATLGAVLLLDKLINRLQRGKAEAEEWAESVVSESGSATEGLAKINAEIERLGKVASKGVNLGGIFFSNQEAADAAQRIDGLRGKQKELTTAAKQEAEERAQAAAQEASEQTVAMQRIRGEVDYTSDAFQNLSAETKDAMRTASREIVTTAFTFDDLSDQAEKGLKEFQAVFLRNVRFMDQWRSDLNFLFRHGFEAVAVGLRDAGPGMAKVARGLVDQILSGRGLGKFGPMVEELIRSAKQNQIDVAFDEWSPNFQEKGEAAADALLEGVSTIPPDMQQVMGRAAADTSETWKQGWAELNSETRTQGSRLVATVAASGGEVVSVVRGARGEFQLFGQDAAGTVRTINAQNFAGLQAAAQQLFVQLGYPQARAKKLADELIRVGGLNPRPKVEAIGLTDGIVNTDRLASGLHNLPNIRRTVRITTFLRTIRIGRGDAISGGQVSYHTGGMPRFHTGGIPLAANELMAVLQRGEFVQPVAAVRQPNAVEFFESIRRMANNGARIDFGGLLAALQVGVGTARRFHTGGMVPVAALAPVPVGPRPQPRYPAVMHEQTGGRQESRNQTALLDRIANRLDAMDRRLERLDHAHDIVMDREKLGSALDRRAARIRRGRT